MVNDIIVFFNNQPIVLINIFPAGDLVFDAVNQARSRKHKRKFTFDFRRRCHSGSEAFPFSSSDFLSQQDFLLRARFPELFNSYSRNNSRIFRFRERYSYTICPLNFISCVGFPSILS